MRLGFIMRANLTAGKPANGLTQSEFLGGSRMLRGDALRRLKKRYMADADAEQ